MIKYYIVLFFIKEIILHATSNITKINLLYYNKINAPIMDNL